MADKGLAKALKRKIVPDEDILRRIEVSAADTSLLMNSSRRRIFEYVCNFPCSHLRAISRATGFSAQTVKWHLRMLMEGGLISESYHGKRRLFYPLKNIIKAEECVILALLSKEEMRKVYTFIEKCPKTSQKEMEKSLNIYQQMLSRILLSLENSGLISHKRGGRRKLYHVTGKFRELEDKFDERSETFEKALMQALEKDGLNPNIRVSDTSTLLIELNIGWEEQTILRVHRNPLSTLLKTNR